MMKRRLIFAFLAAVILLGAMAPMAFASSVLASRHIADGSCGEGLSWSLDGYTLTISGDGEMDDGCPWIEHMDHIEHVVLDGKITKIGKEAFYKFDRLETVDFGEALVEVGTRAFYGCDDIAYIHLPATFRTFGAESFRDCQSHSGTARVCSMFTVTVLCPVLMTAACIPAISLWCSIPPIIPGPASIPLS